MIVLLVYKFFLHILYRNIFYNFTKKNKRQIQFRPTKVSRDNVAGEIQLEQSIANPETDHVIADPTRPVHFCLRYKRKNAQLD